ncbi:MAG TPA: winged helix-turn-helix transcriptional regulator [Solirubrobacterales bacterium]
MRVGSQTLTLLGAPRIFLILRSLAEGPRAQIDLRRDAGSPAQSTLRSHLRTLDAADAIVKRRRDSFPGTLEYELTEAGRELLVVAASLQRWLTLTPQGPLELGSDPARAAIKGLVDGWLARILDPLASEPLSLTELDRRLTTVSYPTLERRLETMRLTEQIEAKTRNGGGTPYTISAWVRHGIAPLAVAARWEERNKQAGADPIARRDIDSALTIAGPLFELPMQVSGICQLAVRIPDGNRRRRFLGVIEAQSGKVEFDAVYPQREPDAWASGTVETWFSAIVDADTSGLKLSGDSDLVRALLDAFHGGLFARDVAERQGESPAAPH